MATTFRIEPQGPFDLLASKRFIEGFTPAGQQRTADEGVLVLVLLTDDWDAVTVRVHQTPTRVVGEVLAGEADHDVLRRQVARVLSLDVDGSGFTAMAEDDEVLRGLVTLYGGLRPVLFSTPFESACWSVLSQRIRMSQAAAVRARLVEQHGAALVADDDEERRAFPSPEAVLGVEQVDGVSDEKLRRLHAVAEAALEGRLDATELREQPVDEALAALREIRGIGAFGSELVLVRGAGAPDVFPSKEPRFHTAMAELYGRDAEDVDGLRDVADGWRPYRSWAAVLLRAWWEDHRR